jgi:hypothetical protein
MVKEGKGGGEGYPYLASLFMSLKETVPRDFRLQVFFTNQFHASENFHVISQFRRKIKKLFALGAAEWSFITRVNCHMMLQIPRHRKGLCAMAAAA